MQTAFSSQLLATTDGQEADSILRACVHCGFCTATCPTFLETGNELDSPRGRIYLIKSLLEDEEVTAVTRQHLDRCLTCQSCETTCPSNVNYHALLDIGRRTLDSKLRRPLLWTWRAWALRRVSTSPGLQRLMLGLGRSFAFLLPASLRSMVRAPEAGDWAPADGERRMLILNGCVQEGLSPDINAAASRVFSRLGITLYTVSAEGCCGALAWHLDAQDEGRAKAKRKVDVLCAALDDGAEAIVSTTSGCGNFIQDYPRVFRDDPGYAQKAARVVAATRDIAEVLSGENLDALQFKGSSRAAFQCPCTLQHGLGAGGLTTALLQKLGFELAPVAEGHLCCGSAGAYSVMQPAMANSLRTRKLQNLQQGNPELIVTANIGCQLHLAREATVPVKHWIVHLDSVLGTLESRKPARTEDQIQTQAKK